MINTEKSKNPLMNYKPISTSSKRSVSKSIEKIPNKSNQVDNKLIKHSPGSDKDLVQIPLNNNTVVSITRTSEKKPPLPHINHELKNVVCSIDERKYPVVDRQSIQWVNQISPQNSRGIMKDIEYLSPIENRGGVQYLNDTSRRVTFEFEPNESYNYSKYYQNLEMGDNQYNYADNRNSNRMSQAQEMLNNFKFQPQITHNNNNDRGYIQNNAENENIAQQRPTISESPRKSLRARENGSYRGQSVGYRLDTSNSRDSQRLVYVERRANSASMNINHRPPSLPRVSQVLTSRSIRGQVSDVNSSIKNQSLGRYTNPSSPPTDWLVRTETGASNNLRDSSRDMLRYSRTVTTVTTPIRISDNNLNINSNSYRQDSNVQYNSRRGNEETSVARSYQSRGGVSNHSREETRGLSFLSPNNERGAVKYPHTTQSPSQQTKYNQTPSTEPTKQNSWVKIKQENTHSQNQGIIQVNKENQDYNYKMNINMSKDTISNTPAPFSVSFSYFIKLFFKYKNLTHRLEFY